MGQIAEVEGKWRGIDEMEEGREDGEDKGESRRGSIGGNGTKEEEGYRWRR